MTQAPRGLTPLALLCEKHGAHLALRLVGELQPGEDAPFPDSPEDADWVQRRETLVLTVLRGDSEGIVLATWMRGGTETSEERRIPRAELDPWLLEVEARGGWSLDALPRIDLGDAHAWFEHEAYEYFDADPDSLDLDSWKPPRHARIGRSRNGGDLGAARRLLAAWARFLPSGLASSSALAPAFAG